MKRRLAYGLLALVLSVNLVIGAKVYTNSAATVEKESAYPSLELFSYVMERVRKDYVDGDQLSYRELIQSALKGMLNDLDPHSEFMDVSKFRDLQNDTQGAFGGLGVVISMREGFITVVAPMDESPGFEAGILPGDRIVSIDGESTDNMSLDEVVKSLRGEPGTGVKLGTFRPSTNETKEYELTRREIHVDMVKDINGKKEFPLGEDKIGYVRLVQFGEKTGEELDAALKKLKAQGMQSLILDLRWNPGGLLEQAVEVCEKFLPRGALVVTTEGRGPTQNSVRRANGKNGDFREIPLAVLVNLGSASASEIVAGCFQDVNRAVIIGEKTFGKGSVQSILPLHDGSALRLTTAKYYTPSHKVIHERGITPDIIVPLTPEEERGIALRRTPGGVQSLSETEREEILRMRDPQLDRARDMLKGIKVFTGRNPEWEARMAARRVPAESANSR